MARVVLLNRANDDTKKKLNFDDEFSSPLLHQNGCGKTKISRKPDDWSLRIILIIFVLSAVASRLLYLYFDVNGFRLLGGIASNFFKGFYFRKCLKAVGIGLSFGTFTWMITYLDSKVPGINPPTPLSPRNNSYGSRKNTHFFHLNYILAITLGVVVFIVMMWQL